MANSLITPSATAATGATGTQQTRKRRQVMTPTGEATSVREAAKREGIAPSTITRRARKGAGYRYASGESTVT